MKSRYENTPIKIVDNKQMITSGDAYINRPIPIEQIKSVVIKYNGERMDQLAYKYLGSAHYWWIICKMNNLYGNFWRINPGTNLIIPTDIDEILSYF